MTPLRLRYPEPDGRIRRCLGCDRPFKTRGRAFPISNRGALSSWCRPCRIDHAPIDTLTWAGIAPEQPATAMAAD